MARLTRLLLSCCAMLLATACTRVVSGEALPAFGAVPLGVLDPVAVLLDQSRMRAITGAGDHLTIIPSMDGRYPVDIEDLAATAPPECRFVFAETSVFGPEVKAFHKTTFQDPPDGRLISEGAASYPDGGTARRAFDRLVATVQRCADTSMGWLFINTWDADADSLHMRPGSCGRDYRLRSVALLEVTFCGFPDSVSDIVMTNIVANVPGS
ncbi:sensor domain-containing protein [Mycobacterium sp. ML4]